jgi:hypothetical protein
MRYTGKSFPFSEFRDDSRFWHARTIHTNIEGVTKTNPDGTDRQEIISKLCGCGDALYLARERGNPVHPNAIQVLWLVCPDCPDHAHVGEQLGYVSHELAVFACRNAPSDSRSKNRRMIERSTPCGIDRKAGLRNQHIQQSLARCSELCSRSYRTQTRFRRLEASAGNSSREICERRAKAISSVAYFKST